MVEAVRRNVPGMWFSMVIYAQLCNPVRLLVHRVLVFVMTMSTSVGGMLAVLERLREIEEATADAPDAPWGTRCAAALGELACALEALPHSKSVLDRMAYIGPELVVGVISDFEPYETLVLKRVRGVAAKHIFQMWIQMTRAVCDTTPVRRSTISPSAVDMVQRFSKTTDAWDDTMREVAVESPWPRLVTAYRGVRMIHADVRFWLGTLPAHGVKVGVVDILLLFDDRARQTMSSYRNRERFDSLVERAFAGE